MIESPRNPELSESLTTTIAHSELPSVAAEITDALLASHLPIISSLRGIWKTGVTVKDALLVRRLAAFLSDLSAIPTERRKQMLDSLQAENTAEDVGEKLLTVLDRLESTQKARLLSRAFALYTSEAISGDEFWRVSSILERLPLRDIIGLKDWRTLDLNTVEEVRRQQYLAVGLGWFVLNASSTGFQWTQRLCLIFSDHLLNETADP